MVIARDILDKARRCTHLNALQGQIVELQYFGGLSEEEFATVLWSHAGLSRVNGEPHVPGCTTA